MLFCGQCGLQLAPGSTACPRCGSVTQPALPPIENPHFDDPTIQSDPHLPLHRPQTTFANPHSEDATIASDPGLSQYPPRTPFPQIPATPTPTPLPPARAYPPSQPGYSGYPGNPGYPSNVPSAGVDYSTQHMQDTRFPAPGPINYPPSTPGYTNFARGGADVPPPQEQPPARRGKWGLMVFLLVLLLVASVTVIFFVKPAWLPGGLNTPQTPTATTASATATATTTLTATATSGTSAVQPARATIQAYYTDINNRDYQSAYNLWLSYPQDEAQFASGFTNTIQDTLTITGASLQPDGTVQVSVTLMAQNTTGTTTYHGYYIVQLYNGSWLIQRGHLA